MVSRVRANGPGPPGLVRGVGWHRPRPGTAELAAGVRERSRPAGVRAWAPADDAAEPPGRAGAGAGSMRSRSCAGQEASRIAELIPLRYSPDAGLPVHVLSRRGGGDGRRSRRGPADGSFLVQLCGDAHLDNFGLFASPERRLMFDLNDFDETYPGPFEWDVKRLVASLEVAMQQAGHGPADRKGVVLAAAAAYRERMHHYAGRTGLEVFYSHIDADALLAERPAEATDKEYAATSRAVARGRAAATPGRRSASSPRRSTAGSRLQPRAAGAGAGRVPAARCRPAGADDVDRLTAGGVRPARCRRIAAGCCSSTTWSRSPGESSGSAVSGPPRGSCC